MVTFPQHRYCVSLSSRYGLSGEKHVLRLTVANCGVVFTIESNCSDNNTHSSSTLGFVENGANSTTTESYCKSGLIPSGKVYILKYLEQAIFCSYTTITTSASQKSVLSGLSGQCFGVKPAHNFQVKATFTHLDT